MPVYWTSAKQYTIGGRPFNQPTASLSGVGEEVVDVTVPVAWAGTLTTRTDANTGTITATDAGHLITTGARVDIYWTLLGVNYCQRAVTVGTVSGTAIPFDLGIGDNLPVAQTAVTVCTSVGYTFSFAGDNVKALAIAADGQATVVLASGTVTEQLAKMFTAADAYGWSTSDSETNPIAGDTITFAFMSQASATTTVRVAAGVVKIA